MHILEIPSFFPPYGGEFCLDQAKALKALGHEVRILSNVQLSIKRSLKEYVSFPYVRWWELMDGLEVYRSYQRGVPKVIKPNVQRWVGIVVSMFADYVKQYGKPDILHAHCAKWAGYAAMIISGKHHIPYVITEHLSLLIFEEEFGRAPTEAWQVPLLREAYEKANCVITVSNEWTDSVSSFYGTNYKHQYISNIVDVDFFHYKQREPLAGRPFRFCCIANNIPLKGYDVLLPAFEKMNNRNAELHIAGFGTEKNDMRQQVKKLAPTSQIILYGRISKAAVRDLLWKCDALVLASRSEVQPLSVLEAMSTGIPAVVTEVVPSCMRIANGCRVVPLNNVKEMAQAMDSLISKYPHSLENLSKKVVEMSSPLFVARQLEQLFLEIHHQSSDC